MLEGPRDLDLRRGRTSTTQRATTGGRPYGPMRLPRTVDVRRGRPQGVAFLSAARWLAASSSAFGRGPSAKPTAIVFAVGRRFSQRATKRSGPYGTPARACGR